MTRILDYNLLRDASLSASSESDLYPLENLYSKRRVKQFYFTGFVSENITIFKAGQSFDSLIIDSHNLTDSATVKLQANATDVWTSPSVDITLTVADTISYFFSSSQSYDYVRLTFEDPTNTEAIQIGMAFLATSKQVCIRDGYISTVTNIGRALYRAFDFSIPYSTGTATINDFFEKTFGTIQLSATRQQFGTAWPFYVIPDTDDVVNFPPLYSVISGSVARNKVETRTFAYDIPISVEEVN